MDGWITIGTKLDTKSFDKQVQELEYKLEDLEKQKIYFSDNNMVGELKDVEVEIEKTKNKLIQLNAQKNKLGDTAPIDKMGKSFQNSIKHIGRVVLGIFGIRSAYLAMRRAASDLESYDPQFAANLEYIRFVLTQAIAPVLKWIVNLAGTLLSYIYAILNAWFGIGAKLNLGANAFQKMKAGASGVSKAVKEIKRELLGFDEITRLTEQSDTGTSAGAGGVGMPDFDLDNLNADVPKWIKWIMDHKSLVLGVLGTIAAIIATIKIANLISGLKNVFGIVKSFSALQIVGMITGIAIAIQGVIETISAIIKYIKNPTWNNFRKVLGGIEKALIGVGIAMVAFNATNPVGWIILATAGVLELTTALMKDRAQIMSVKEAQEKLNNAMKKTKEATDAYVNAVDNAEQSEKNLLETEKKHKISGEELYKAVQQGTLDYKNMNEAQREVYKAYLNNKNAQDELLQSTSDLTSAKKEETDASLENSLAIADEKGNYDEFKKSVIEAYNEGKISASEARDLIERAMGGMSKASKKTFTEDLPSDIASGLDPNKYSGLWYTFQRRWNEFINGLKTNLTFSVGIGSGGGFSGGGGGGRRCRSAAEVVLKEEYSILVNCQN